MVGKLNEVEDLTREIELMKDLEHANIVGYVGAWVSEDTVCFLKILFILVVFINNIFVIIIPMVTVTVFLFLML